AGRSGVNAANQLRAAGNLHPVGFLDDDPKKIGLLVAGLKVLGTVSLLSSLVPKYRVEQVILCIPSPPHELLRRIWAASELLGVKVKIVPTLEEILGRKINIPNFRNIEMNDLLGRKPVEKVADDPAMVAAYAGKRIL